MKKYLVVLSLILAACSSSSKTGATGSDHGRIGNLACTSARELLPQETSMSLSEMAGKLGADPSMTSETLDQIADCLDSSFNIYCNLGRCTIEEK